VVSAGIRTRGQKAITLHAKRFVLATGGIENARLLLLSGIGNEYDQVGRYFMNHPKNALGVISPARAVRHLPAYFGFLRKGWAGYIGLRLNDCTQRQLGVLNSYVRFEPLYPWSDRAGVQLLIKYIKSKRWLWQKLERFKGETATLRDYAETGDDPDFDLGGERAPRLGRLMLEMAKDSPFVAQYGFYRVFDKLRPRVPAIRIRNFIEMEPHPDNRVILGDEKDCFGNPLPMVRNWATPLDQRSLAELHHILSEELDAMGFGTLTSDFISPHSAFRIPHSAFGWPIDNDASHHLGTTRMGTEARTSVVDADCRVHGVANLYIAGGSVFSASGFANPTYTIVALAIRLARYLEKISPG
jgi:choline dehydrogenase-like flavoprotein